MTPKKGNATQPSSEGRAAFCIYACLRRIRPTTLPQQTAEA